MSTATPTASPDAPTGLTTADKVRRVVIGVVVVFAFAVLFFACRSTTETGPTGQLVEQGDGPGDVTISGDGDAIAENPPGANRDPDGPGNAAATVLQTFPSDGASVLNQEQVGVAFAQGYTGDLRINGIAIPEAQILRRPELNQAFFQPGAGTATGELPAGRNCAAVSAYPVNGDPSSARVTTWCFDVA